MQIRCVLINVKIFIVKKQTFLFLNPKEVYKNALYIATGGFLLVLSFKNYEPNLKFLERN